MKQEFITVGTVVGAHGIRGELKVYPLGVEPTCLAEFDTLYLGGAPMKVLAARVHKHTVLLTLPGVEDMNAALVLKGKTLAVRRADAALPEGMFFDQELVGLAVVDEATGQTIGTLERVFHYPAHDVYEVKGQREYLIPAVPEVFIARVDVEGGEMTVRLRKGLATDEN